MSNEPGEDWRPLADRIARHAQDFLDGVTALANGEGKDQMVPLLLLEVAQILLAGAQLGASQDIIPAGNWEPDVGADPDLDALRTGLAGRLRDCDEYAELFDPYQDTTATPFRLSDDLAAVSADLIHGLQHYQAGRVAEVEPRTRPTVPSSACCAHVVASPSAGSYENEQHDSGGRLSENADPLHVGHASRTAAAAPARRRIVRPFAVKTSSEGAESPMRERNRP